MRRRFNESLRIGVSTGSVALVAARGKREVTVLAEQRCADTNIDTVCATMRMLLADAPCRGWPTTIVVADELARIWQVAPAADSSRMADLEAAAALRFQTLYGDPPASWQIAASYDALRPFLAAAMPRQLIALLEQSGATQQLKVVEIVPQFVAGWNRWRGFLKADAWYGLVHDNVLTLGALERGELRAVRATQIAGGAAWLEEHVSREALRLNLAAPAQLMISGAVPATWNASCTQLGPAADWTAAVRLAATGSCA